MWKKGPWCFHLGKICLHIMLVSIGNAYTSGTDWIIVLYTWTELEKRLSNCTKPIIHLLRKIFKVCYILVLNMSRKTGPHYHLIWGGELGGEGG